MKRGKEIYDNIVIPDELAERVQQAIASVDNKSGGKESRKAKSGIIVPMIKGLGTLAAALFICLTIGVNTSQVFANGLSGIPVIGALARVLTIRSYEAVEGDVDINVKVPEIQVTPITANPSGQETDSEKDLLDLNGNKDFVADINKEIDALVEAHVAKCKQDMEEYKTAFFETGGTEEEWAQRTMDVDVHYEVKYQNGPYLSIVLTASEGWVTAYSEQTYYNLDLSDNSSVTLEELLGSDYIARCNESILAQIEERMAEDEMILYFGFGEDELQDAKFVTITEDTPFYINEAGNPVVCFAKYEISPGFMGVQEFEIVK